MRMRGTHWMPLVTLVALLLQPGGALAQRSGGPVDIQLFRPAVDSKGYFTLNSSQVLRHLDPSFGLVVNWSRRPLLLEGPTAGGQWRASDGSVIPSRYQIDNLVTGNLQAALGLFKHFEVGLGLPITIWNGDTDPNPKAGQNPTDTGSIDAQGIGDLALHFKGRILNTSRHPVGLGAVLSLGFPTGDKEKFLGTGRFGIHPNVVVDKEFFEGRLSLAVNLGARFLTGSRTWTDNRGCEPQTGTPPQPLPVCGTGTTIDHSHHLTYGLGAAVYLVPQRLSFVAEIIGQTGFSGFADASKLNSAHEILGGFKLYLARNSYFAVGVGRGLRGGGANYQYGSPDVRVFGAFIFEPSIGDRDGDGIKDDVDKCPDEPEDFDDFEDEDGCPDPDNDRDGILDKDDKCPNEPENYNKFEDDDGCPDNPVLDRDGDGIPDDKDKCVTEAEDKDGFQDEDGCPDLDNDGDGIPDDLDKCPNEPEDKDGFQDEDGCPDLDNDGDGIPDDRDKCPSEPETVNGYQDEDGCPDTPPTGVQVAGGKINIPEQIQFKRGSAVLDPVSYKLLNEIGRKIIANPQIGVVRIEGHTDDSGSKEANERLSQARADSVKEYLVSKGVPADRLQTAGYGSSRPIDPKKTDAARAKNRRVEFVVIQAKDKSAPVPTP